MVVAWQSVESSNVAAIRYDEESQELGVRFPSGSEYVYKDVPGKVANLFLNADSKGKYLNEHIKGKYEYEKV